MTHHLLVKADPDSLDFLDLPQESCNLEPTTIYSVGKNV